MVLIPDNPRITLFVGETGSGKSSTIHALLDRFSDRTYDVLIGHSVESCTRESSKYWCNEEYGYLIDTQGTNDSREMVNDLDSLSAPLREIMISDETFSEGKCNLPNNAVDIRVVWCCNANERSVASLKRQAEFISSIFEEYGPGEARGDGWKSVVALVKKGSSNQHRDSIVNATSHDGSPGLTGGSILMADVLEWGPPDDENRREDKNYFMTRTVAQRRKRCKFLEDEYVREVHELLEKTPCARLAFRREKCSKCNEQGDSRFFLNKCHSRMDPFHPERETGSQNALSGLTLRTRRAYGSVVRWYQDLRWEDWSCAIIAAVLRVFSVDIVSANVLSVFFTWLGIVAQVLGDVWLCYRKIMCLDLCPDCGRAWSEPGCKTRCARCLRLKGSEGCSVIESHDVVEENE